MELVPTPTYASYLNPVECHFTPISQFVVANADYLDWGRLRVRAPPHLPQRRSPRASPRRRRNPAPHRRLTHAISSPTKPQGPLARLVPAERDCRPSMAMSIQTTEAAVVLTVNAPAPAAAIPRRAVRGVRGVTSTLPEPVGAGAQVRPRFWRPSRSAHDPSGRAVNLKRVSADKQDLAIAAPRSAIEGVGRSGSGKS